VKKFLDTNHIDPCCPTDPDQRILWEGKLQKELDDFELKYGEKIANQENLLKNLSHSIRLGILQYLRIRPNCVCELVIKLKTSNSAISYHLSSLVNGGMIINENHAGRIYYSLTNYGKTILKWLETLPELG
jgi:DNA-binding transcriptional ArsR family regulator